MIRSYGELDDRHIDVLCELGNIGTGNAATSLSEMIDDTVRISVPRVMLLGCDDVVGMAGGAETPGVAVMIRFEGDVRGIVLFVISYDDAKIVAEMLIDDVPGSGRNGDPGMISDMNLSAIMEIGNILGASYLSSVAALTGLRIEATAPYVSVDMIGAAMSAPIAEFSVGNSRILLIEGGFSTETRKLKSHVILFADIPSLNTIMMKLGIEA